MRVAWVEGSGVLAGTGEHTLLLVSGAPQSVAHTRPPSNECGVFVRGCGPDGSGGSASASLPS